jgi:quinone-modifying oxidoreductase subunit QmoB
MDCDLVVLATGQVPNTGPDPYAQLMVKEAEDEETRAAAQKALEVAPPSILNLDYRQGTDPPHLKSGFVDSHFICFPVVCPLGPAAPASTPPVPCAVPWT